MRVKIMIALSVIVLVILNYAVYDKEQIIENGETVLLELAPADPRSLIQGDYMRLRYEIERIFTGNTTIPEAKSSHLIIKPNTQRIAVFQRFDDGTPLSDDEKRLYYHLKYGRIRIVPDSFFFQEGHADKYNNAKYGVFKFDDKGNHILVGLVDQP
ncbi:GDYXXLXY domain-containing protein [Kiloniella antarctica]|uniref:GDYXXLXY domain-containing protein n=1 Tax=Kiloniella antarctica TaxID=1550907 RepID=A0ABW5BHN4_9PROT